MAMDIRTLTRLVTTARFGSLQMVLMYGQTNLLNGSILIQTATEIIQQVYSRTIAPVT